MSQDNSQNHQQNLDTDNASQFEIDDELVKQLDELVGGEKNAPSDVFGISDEELEFLSKLNQTLEKPLDNSITESVDVPTSTLDTSNIPTTDSANTNSEVASVPTKDTPIIAPPLAKSGAKSLFGKKTNKPSNATSRAVSKTSKTNNKPVTIIIIAAVILLLVLVAAWLLVGNKQEDMPMQNVAQTAPVASETITDTQNAGSDEMATEMAPTDDAATPSLTVDISPVDVDEIVKADIPKDPALIKEELDLLADKETRLAEQEKIIEEQLALMQDLTLNKEEQIALLEAQIAQLEAQQSQK